MIQKLDMLVRFWELSARHATLGHPLVPSEQAELLSLMQQVPADTPAFEPGHDEPANDSFPVQIVAEEATLPAELREVSASGMRLTCAGSVKEGAHVVVRAADALRGVEYVVPCRVTLVHPGAPSVVTLVVDGAPSRVSFVAGTDRRVRDLAVMGRRLRRVG